MPVVAQLPMAPQPGEQSYCSRFDGVPFSCRYTGSDGRTQLGMPVLRIDDLPIDARMPTVGGVDGAGV